MKEKLKKFTSRKFIVTAISMVAGLVTMVAGLVTMAIGHDQVVQIIASALMTIVPAVVYCIMEGKIDAASVKTITDAAANAAEQLGQEEVADVIEQAGEVAGALVDDTAE